MILTQTIFLLTQQIQIFYLYGQICPRLTLNTVSLKRCTFLFNSHYLFILFPKLKGLMKSYVLIGNVFIFFSNLKNIAT